MAATIPIPAQLNDRRRCVSRTCMLSFLRSVLADRWIELACILSASLLILYCTVLYCAVLQCACLDHGEVSVDFLLPSALCSLLGNQCQIYHLLSTKSFLQPQCMMVFSLALATTALTTCGTECSKSSGLPWGSFPAAYGIRGWYHYHCNRLALLPEFSWFIS